VGLIRSGPQGPKRRWPLDNPLLSYALWIVVVILTAALIAALIIR
jgi:hypothetical protein